MQNDQVSFVTFSFNVIWVLHPCTVPSHVGFSYSTHLLHRVCFVRPLKIRIEMQVITLRVVAVGPVSDNFRIVFRVFLDCFRIVSDLFGRFSNYFRLFSQHRLILFWRRCLHDRRFCRRRRCHPLLFPPLPPCRRRPLPALRKRNSSSAFGVTK